MNNKERALLKKDLCGRLPYNVKIEANVCPRVLFPMDVVAENLPKPYLRHLSSMTDDEKKDFEKAAQKDIDIALNEVNRQHKSKLDQYAPLLSAYNKFDWLNEHHFDYRGLIGMGLAYEAPEGMYDTKYKVMTPQDKKLVINDLCARLPYGVICHTSVGDYRLLGIDGYDVHLDSPVYDVGDGYFDLGCEEVKPYLRSVSLSNMTMDERYEYGKFINGKVFEYDNATAWTRWLNEHHFDYNGLIEKGLALEATKGMYDEKE